MSSSTGLKRILTTWPKRNVLKKIAFLTSALIIFNFFLIPNNNDDYEINNLGPNRNVVIRKDRDKEATELKTILMWNDAYGVREYDIGHGREPFYKYKCPETRCFATANRSYFDDIGKFDALLIHQRGIDWNDMPQKRDQHQRYIHWNMESAQYLYMDIHKLDDMFNWTMTYKRNSDFFLPYAYVIKTKEHPEKGPALDRYIRDFGLKNKHLAAGKKKGDRPRAAWFVSHCATVARREKYVKYLQRHMDVDIYGACGKLQCSRSNETECYLNMERDYKFYLSFENSICDDYVTEKYFNILKYNVIPVVYGGSDYDNEVGPPKGSINALHFASPQKLAKKLTEIDEDDAKFAEFFWWRDFYELRTGPEHRAQPYCELCRRLNDPNEPEKVVKNMYHWWVTDSHCRRLKLSSING